MNPDLLKLGMQSVDNDPEAYREAVRGAIAEFFDDVDELALADAFADEFPGMQAGTSEISRIVEEQISGGADPNIVRGIELGFNLAQWALARLVQSRQLPRLEDDSATE